MIAAVSGAANAQETAAPQGAQEVQEIVVTAERRPEELKDVPASITAFTGAQLERERIQTLADYTALSPNVGFVSYGSSTQQDFTIRGVSNLGGFTRSTAIYVDEFNVTPSSLTAGLAQSLVDVSQLEVLRGPQGVFFGRNVIGGAVSITTTKPTDVDEAYVSTEYSSYDSFLFKAMLNIPLAPGIYSRFSGYYQQSDGYLHNVGTGPGDSSENFGIRGTFRLEPTSKLTVDLTWQYNHLDSQNLDSVPTGELSPIYAQLGVTQSIDNGEGFYPYNTNRIATNEPYETVNGSAQATARVDWDLGAFSLIGVNGYILNQAHELGDADGTTLDAYSDNNRDTVRSVSTEWRLQSNGSGPFQWVAGVSYADDRSVLLFYQTGGAQFPGPYGPYLYGADINGTVTTSDTRSVGVFGNVSYKLFNRLTLSVGGRFSHDAVASTNVDNSVFGTGQLSQGSVPFNDFSPRFSAVYDINPSLNAYGVISHGYKPGGYNLAVAQVPGLPQSFTPESAWNYEAGLKGSAFSGFVHSSLSLFYLKWTNLQVAAYDDTGVFAGYSFISNAAQASSRGVEWEGSVGPYHGISLHGGLGYDKAVFDSYPNAVDSDGLGTATPDGTTRLFNATGNTLPFAPRWTDDISVQYKRTLPNGLDAYVEFTSTYKSLQFTDSRNRTVNVLTGAQLFETQIPGYDLCNLRIGLDGRSWTAQLFANNLLDTHRYIGVEDTHFALSGTHVILAPQVFGIRLSYKYN